MKITESQLRSVVKKIVREQAEMQKLDYKELPAPRGTPTFTSYAAAKADANDSMSPIPGTLKVYKDPTSGKFWYSANYDTWGT
jgi:hypothetical protein